MHQRRTNHHLTINEYGIGTQAVHTGRADLRERGVHAVPLDLSTTYPAADSAAGAELLDAITAGEEPPDSPVYGRLGNETVRRFESAIAGLEGSAEAVAYATGMAALSGCLLATAAAGKPHVVGLRPLYGTSDHLLDSGLLGTRVSWAYSIEDVARLIGPQTGLVMAETPANPTLAEVDIRALADACGDVPLLVDNTFATPVLQRPIEHGARIVVHSATKFLGGHGDTMGGVVACDPDLAKALRQVRHVTGGILHPWAAYLLLRGLSTLPVRIRTSSATAAEIADRLAAHPRVAAVHYPGRRTDRPGGQLEGGGALVAFEVEGDARAVVAAVDLITPAVSLGTVDTLIQHPASLTHRIMSADDRAAGGIDDRLLRLSVGLEDVDDLWRDLDKALAGA